MRLRMMVVVTACALLVGCGGDNEVAAPDVPVLPEAYATLLADVVPTDPFDPLAIVETGKGIFVIELFEVQAPRSTKHIMSLIEQGFYDGLMFHQVTPGFSVQTGDPTGTGNGGADVAPVPLEIHPDLSHDRAGIVGLSHFIDDPQSATSQFYITLAPAPSLDGKYAIFGGVIKGMDVVSQLVRGDRIVQVVTVRPTPVPAE